jgi:hypothetical protein
MEQILFPMLAFQASMSTQNQILLPPSVECEFFGDGINPPKLFPGLSSMKRLAHYIGTCQLIVNF